MVKRILKSKVTSWISLIIGLLATAIIFMAILFHTDYFANRTGGMFSRFLFGGTGFSLEFKKIAGNPFDNIRIEKLRIRYTGVDYSFDVLRVEEIKCKFDLRSLFSNNPVIYSIELQDPHVWMKPDSSGMLIIPFSGEKGGGRLQRFDIEKFLIKDGQVIYQGEAGADAVKELNMEGRLKSDGRQVFVELTSGSGEEIRRKLFFRNIRGTIRRIPRGSGYGVGPQTGERIVLEDLFVELDESILLLNGTINPDSVFFDLNIVAEPFNVEEIAGLIGIEGSYFGELQGVVAVKGILGDIEIRGMLNGIFSGYALDGFKIHMEWKRPVLKLVRGQGRFNGSLVDGTGELSLKDTGRVDLDLVVEDLDLSSGFIRNNNIPESLFNGRLGLTYDFQSEEFQFNMDLDKGQLRKVPFEKAIVNGSYRADTLFIDRLNMVASTHSVEARGVISSKGEMRFYIDLACSKEDTLFPYFGIENYRADVILNGIWEGDFENWVLRASGDCSDFLYKGANIPAGKIKFALKKEDLFQFFLDLQGDSCLVGPFDFSGIDLSLEYANGVTSINRLFLERSGLFVEMRADVARSIDRTEIVFKDVVIDALEEKWVSNGNFSVYINDSKVIFDDMQLHSRLGAFFMDCVIDKRNNAIDGVFAFDRLGLSLCNASGFMRKPVAGRARGKLICSGSLDDPSFKLDLAIGQSLFDSLAVDSLVLLAEYSNNLIRIDTFVIKSPEGKLSLGGKIEGTDPKTLYHDKEQALKCVAVDLDVECTDLSLSPILSLIKGSPFSEGNFTGTVSLRDSLAHPLLGIEGKIEGLSSGNLKIPVIQLSADVDSMMISVEGRIEVAPGLTGRFNGDVPLESRDWFYSIALDEALSLELHLPEGDLSCITEITEFVAEAEGLFSMGFSVTGTVSDPMIRGEIVLDDAGFRMAGMEERFRGVRGRVILEDTLITVVELEGREGRDGSFDCSGTINLEGWKPRKYDLKLELDKFQLVSIPDVMAIVSGDLKIGTATEGERKIPDVTGNLVVNRAEIYIDFGDFASAKSSGSLEPPSWLAAVDIEVKGNTSLKTPDANVEMRGDITVHHDQKGTYLRGRLDLVRGWYNVYNNKFRVASGRLQFQRAGSFRPVIDVDAETFDPEGRKIYLSLAWHQDDIEPRISLHHEDPGYSETDIWKMLGGGMVGNTESAGTSWDAMNTAQNLAANYLERMLNLHMQGITIELDTSRGSSNIASGFEPEETIVAIGKHLSEGLYVKYKQGLSISTARHFEVEYRISRLFLIRSEVIMFSEKILPGRSRRSSDEINVDFKVRWEF